MTTSFQPQQQPGPQPDDNSQMPIQLTLTLAQVNAVLRILSIGPYGEAKPLIDGITQQAQSHIAQVNAQQAPQPQTNSVSNMQPNALKYGMSE